jgi:hypothetical protein
VEGALSMDTLSVLLNISFLDFKSHNLVKYELNVVPIDMDVMAGNELEINCVNLMKTIGFVPLEHLLAPTFGLLVHGGMSYQTAILFLGSIMGSQMWKHPFRCIAEEISRRVKKDKEDKEEEDEEEGKEEGEEEDKEEDGKGDINSFIQDMVTSKFKCSSHDHIVQALDVSENKDADARQLAMDLLCWLVLVGDEKNLAIKYIQENWEMHMPDYVDGVNFKRHVRHYSLRSQIGKSQDERIDIFKAPLFGDKEFVQLICVALNPNPAIRPPVQNLIDATGVLKSE